MARQLNARERRFVEEYLIDLAPRRAALAAGYSLATARNEAYSWVAGASVKPHLFEAVRQAQAQRAERCAITADRVLAELARIGFADIRKVLAWREAPEAEAPDGPRSKKAGASLRLVDSDALDADTAAAIAEVSQTTTGLKVKMHDKRAALVDIARHLGLFTDRTELGKPGDFAELGLEQKRERAIALARQLGLDRLGPAEG
ncbi:terminase small subunit [Labrys wisconsinensis]|uniref:Phage terminase small subunit n=1 Tax=Labrys wisconsinensis TaxID=425677 RepID=A0ABU0JNT7_9HYPH|nr:terminase small subunit [Labrys wisconsinensis]MDQ0475048.1 phage terminase small subunit [Labrys wisconsinensis]